MNTTIISAEIKTDDVPLLEALLRKFKAKSIKTHTPQDETKMTKEAYFSMIDERRKEKSIPLTKDKMKELFGV